MKKGTVIGIVCAVVSLLLLGGLVLYLTLQNLDTLLLEGSTSAESEAVAAVQALYEPDNEEHKEAETDSGSVSPGVTLIWVGDSRTLGMGNAMKNEDIYIGASGEGYDWLYETGLSQLDSAIREHTDSPVIFNSGVNDYDNLDKYLTLYQTIAEEYPDTHFYFLSVNPIEPTLCKNITNEEITDFNNRLREAFPDTYLDSFTYLMIHETVPIDGIHYSEEDYQLIYAFAAEQIADKEATYE